MFCKLCLIAATLGLGWAAWAQSGDAQRYSGGAVTIHNAREYKGMCRRARTAEEYGALSTWCSSQSSAYATRVAQLQAELREYYSRTGPVGPKYPPRDQTLKELVSHYQTLSARWHERADNYAKWQD